MNEISGSCLCGNVTFSCDDSFSQFHMCHCTQCQKISGSAHVSNLFTKPTNITWLTGKEDVNRFDVPGRSISSAFCRQCGAPVPYVTASGKALIVPAGALDSAPTLTPQDNIFWSEHASWYEAGLKSKKFDTFPK